MGSNRFQFEHQASDVTLSQGTFLVASEMLDGSRFERSVVLLMQDDDRGAFGVVLNKPANDRTRKAWSQLTGSNPGDVPLIAGGPLQGPVFALHQMQALSDVEIQRGLHIAARADKLQKLANTQSDAEYRIFVGVAGWKPGRLTEELDSGLWYTLPLEIETVFEDPQWMWEACTQHYGRLQIESILGTEVPNDDPSLN